MNNEQLATNDYHIAKLNNEQEKEIQKLESEIGCTLIAYRKNDEDESWQGQV